jgi:nucleoside-diphosphate-sugar epimerase
VQPSSNPDTVLVAGASGFVGRALGPALAARHRVVGLSRQDRAGSDGYDRFLRCDLLSLEDTERALVGVRVAVYLVHSMMPSARLTQASFADIDLLCADNFARAAAKAGVERIVYLGGLIPGGGDDPGALSEHLRSRLEVERVLASTGVPVTVLRAGLVLGAAGSSFQIVSRLVRRLPIMVCPRWTHTRTQSVALADVVALLTFAVDDVASAGQIFDIAAPEVVSYLEIMRRVAALSGVRRRFFGVPLFSPGLSRLWLSLVTGAPRALAGPLVESLRHEMTARDDRLARAAGLTPTPFEVALGAAIAEDGRLTADPFATAPKDPNPVRSTVLSIQRITAPAGLDAASLAARYARWCAGTLGWILRVVHDADGSLRFRLRGTGLDLLVLAPMQERSAADRFVYGIVGGSLAIPGQSGTFEFRTTGGGAALTIVREFEPRLPWWIYRVTQAIAHGVVMWAFGRSLAPAH